MQFIRGSKTGQELWSKTFMKTVTKQCKPEVQNPRRPAAWRTGPFVLVYEMEI